MKKISLSKVVLAGLVALGTSFGCQNTDSTLLQTEQIQQNVSAQATPNKNRAKKSLVKINVKDKNQANELAANGIDFFGSGEGGNFDAYATDKQIQFMKSLNIKLTPKNASINDKGGLPGGYHTVQQVLETMKDLNAKYPDMTEIIDIGDSWEKTAGKANNDIWAFVINNKKTKGAKKTGVFMSGIHSRELVTVEINMRFMDLLLSNYGKDPQITQYLDTREVVFIPLENIDGRIAVENGNSMWRKNRHIDNTYDGIDLNRNFDGHWNFDGVVPMTPTLQRYRSQLEEKDSEIYSGPKAFSEPETAALSKFLANRDVTVMIDLHSYGNMIIYPPGYTNAPTPMTPVFKKVAQTMASKNKYRTGTSMELLYPTCGTTKDWAFDKHNAIAFTMEMGNDSDGFRPSFQRVEAMWKENKDVLLYLVSITDNPSKVLR